MSEHLQRELRRARQRLAAQRFLGNFVWSMTAALLLGCLAYGVSLVAGRALPVDWTIVASVGVGLLGTSYFTWRGRPSVLDAAGELDRCFGLKERLSTLLSLPPEHLEGSAAQALRADVERRTTELDAGERIPVSLPRHGWAPLLPLALFVGLAFLGPLDWTREAEGTVVPPEERERIEKEAEQLTKKKADLLKKLEESDALDEELEALTEELTKVGEDVRKDPRLDSKQAALKLEDLAKKFEEQRNRFEDVDFAQRNLEKLANLPPGPAKELAKALKNGDFEKAADELKQMAKKLAEGKMSEEDQQKLAKQLEKLKDDLDKLANLEERRKQLEKSLPPELAKQELAKLQQDAQRMKQLQELAEKLGQCSKCLGGAADGKPGQMGQKLQEQFADAEKLLRELRKDEMACKALDEMLDELAQCKQGMCQGRGQKPGNGLGRGPGRGDRPEAEDETQGRFTRASVESVKGESFLAGKTEGRNFAGDTKLTIQEAAANASRAADEAVTRHRIPREYQKHTQDYFEKLNESLSQ